MVAVRSQAMVFWFDVLIPVNPEGMNS